MFDLLRSQEIGLWDPYLPVSHVCVSGSAPMGLSPRGVMASIRDWPGDVTALAVGHVIGTVIVARAARASGRVCPASHSIIVTMGFASPATVLLWVLALRPSAGSDAIMVPPRRSGDLLEVEDKACAQWQQQLVSSPTAMPEHSECNWFVGLIGIHNASALGDLGAASRRTGNHQADWRVPPHPGVVSVATASAHTAKELR